MASRQPSARFPRWTRAGSQTWSRPCMGGVASDGHACRASGVSHGGKGVHPVHVGGDVQRPSLSPLATHTPIDILS